MFLLIFTLTVSVVATALSPHSRKVTWQQQFYHNSPHPHNTWNHCKLFRGMTPFLHFQFRFTIDTITVTRKVWKIVNVSWCFISIDLNNGLTVVLIVVHFCVLLGGMLIQLGECCFTLQMRQHRKHRWVYFLLHFCHILGFLFNSSISYFEILVVTNVPVL